jgi:hypothetical protein
VLHHTSRVSMSIAVVVAMISAGCAEAPSLPDHAPLHGDHLVIHSSASANGAGLVKTVHSLAARFNTPVQAEKAGYVSTVDCAQHPTAGAMGIHWINNSLMDAEFDPLQPEAVIYMPDDKGKLRLVGVEYIVFPDAETPEGGPLFGDQAFDFNMSPLPEPNYTLHVWAFEENPTGVFSAWNPNISCPE